MHPVATAIALARSRKPHLAPDDIEADEREPILTNEERRFLVRAGIGLGALTLTGVAALIVRSKLRKAAQDRALEDAFEGKPHQQVALKLKHAFEGGNFLGWGTKEEVVRQIVLHEIPSWDFVAKMLPAYKLLTKGGKFFTDLNSELVPSEVNEIMAILRSKPQHDGGFIDPQVIHRSRAERIKAAIDYEDDWGIPWTDYGALEAVMSELKTPADWEALKQAYRTVDTKELPEALDDELWDWEYDWKGAVEKYTGVNVEV